MLLNIFYQFRPSFFGAYQQLNTQHAKPVLRPMSVSFLLQGLVATALVRDEWSVSKWERAVGYFCSKADLVQIKVNLALSPLAL